MKPTTDELIRKLKEEDTAKDTISWILIKNHLQGRLDVLEEELIHLKYLNENFDIGFLWRNYLTKEIARIKKVLK